MAAEMSTSENFQFGLPRCEKLDGSTLRIAPAYAEAGQFCEANCVTITDGERTAVYVAHHLVVSATPAATGPEAINGPRPLCDCERSHNGLGMRGRECDCRSPAPAAAGATELGTVFRGEHVTVILGECPHERKALVTNLTAGPPSYLYCLDCNKPIAGQSTGGAPAGAEE